MDTATVPFTVVTYSEPQQGLARALGATDASESSTPHQPFPTPFEQLAHLRLSAEHDSAARPASDVLTGAQRPHEEDSSDDEPIGECGCLACRYLRSGHARSSFETGQLLVQVNADLTKPTTIQVA